MIEIKVAVYFSVSLFNTLSFYIVNVYGVRVGAICNNIWISVLTIITINICTYIYKKKI